MDRDDQFAGRYFTRNRRRGQFRPRAERMGDRHFGRDFDYWRRQVGHLQPRFDDVVPRHTPRARARNIPYMSRQEFHRRYGDDADFGAWLEARKYNPDDLLDPQTFDQIVYEREFKFNREGFSGREGNRRGDDLTPYELENIQYEADIAAEEEGWRLTKERAFEHHAKRQRESTPDVEDLPLVMVGKKIKFEDAE